MSDKATEKRWRIMYGDHTYGVRTVNHWGPDWPWSPTPFESLLEREDTYAEDTGELQRVAEEETVAQEELNDQRVQVSSQK